MKLAEALVLRADGQKRIEQLQQRLIQNAKVQADDQPAEDPEVLLQEFEQLAQELVLLIQRINRTNCHTELEEGMSIADALAARDIAKLKSDIYRNLAQAAIIKQDRQTKSEIKFQSTIQVSEVQRKADQFAKEHREIDTRVQQANWQTELGD
ncbi:MAG: DIP1984 family protein [Candidatus Poribacteria bacterium]|jgi:hypothetical protein|nr:DIP1984 family protein [Candidatus Poribacteria bacterium]MDP6749916.1 DIP1984 family protein [Candidatus Poribacteria bacterium]MDP6994750.1 DIP1984 family protein [Candidatus Poribacteria bacterium]